MVRARTARFLMFKCHGGKVRVGSRAFELRDYVALIETLIEPLPLDTLEAPHAKGRKDAERGGKGREGAARRGSHPRRLYGRLLELVHKVEDGVVRPDGLRLSLEESLTTEDVPTWQRVEEGDERAMRGRKRVTRGWKTVKSHTGGEVERSGDDGRTLQVLESERFRADT